MKLLPNWRQAWRWWSVRVSALGAALLAFALACPDQLLAIWQTLPPELQAMVPNASQIGIGLFAASILARLVKQREPGNGR